MMKGLYILQFIFYYLYNLLRSNLYIAFDILSPTNHITPGYVWVNIKFESDLGILLFSNLLSMTPGTLSVDLSDDKKKLLVHYLYNNEKNNIINDINNIQDRIKRIVK